MSSTVDKVENGNATCTPEPWIAVENPEINAFEMHLKVLRQIEHNSAFT